MDDHDDVAAMAAAWPPEGGARGEPMTYREHRAADRRPADGAAAPTAGLAAGPFGRRMAAGGAAHRQEPGRARPEMPRPAAGGFAAWPDRPARAPGFGTRHATGMAGYRGRWAGPAAEAEPFAGDAPAAGRPQAARRAEGIRAGRGGAAAGGGGGRPMAGDFFGRFAPAAGTRFAPDGSGRPGGYAQGGSPPQWPAPGDDGGVLPGPAAGAARRDPGDGAVPRDRVSRMGDGPPAGAARGAGAEADARHAARVQAYAAKQDHVRTELPDYDRVVSAARIPVSAALAAALVDSEHTARLEYHLAKNPERLAELNRMPPREAARAVGRLKAAIAGAAEARPTRAPAPLTPLRGGAAGPLRSLAELAASDNAADYIELRRAQRRA